MSHTHDRVSASDLAGQRVACAGMVPQPLPSFCFAANIYQWAYALAVQQVAAEERRRRFWGLGAQHLN